MDAQEDTSERGCQTGLVGGVPLPLPASYPANLVYAQNMLAMCLAQTQQVDLQISLLKMHLRERNWEIQTAAIAFETLVRLGLPVQVAVVHVDPAAVEAALAAAGDDADDEVAAAGLFGAMGAVAAGAVRAAAAGEPMPGGAEGVLAAFPGAARNLERLRAHRRRLFAAVKIALVMVFLEVRTPWFIAYFFAVFLYVGGVFDPIVAWFQRHSTQATLEQTLAQLRDRRRRAEVDLAQPQASAADEAAPAAAADEAAPEARPRSEAEGAASAESLAGEGAAGDTTGLLADPPQVGLLDGTEEPAPDAASPDAAAPVAAMPDAAAPDAEAVAAALAEAERPPYAHRFIYQLLVMFVMTLLPWWNPDPRYL